MRGERRLCYIESLLSKSSSTFSLTSTSTTLPSLTITVSGPNRCSFNACKRVEQEHRVSVADPWGRSTEFNQFTSHSLHPYLCTQRGRVPETSVP
jgi:hypothetical protein